jgi:hypothetical protein
MNSKHYYSGFILCICLIMTIPAMTMALQRPGKKPPQEAIDACVDQSVNAVCTINTPQGDLNGVCRTIQEEFACVPKHLMDDDRMNQGPPQ